MAHFPIDDMKSPAAIRALTFSVELKLFDVGKAEVDKKVKLPALIVMNIKRHNVQNVFTDIQTYIHILHRHANLQTLHVTTGKQFVWW